MEMKVVHSSPTLSHSSLSDWDISVWLVVASGLTKKHEAEINMLLLLLEQAFKHKPAQSLKAPSFLLYSTCLRYVSGMVYQADKGRLLYSTPKAKNNIKNTS